MPAAAASLSGLTVGVSQQLSCPRAACTKFPRTSGGAPTAIGFSASLAPCLFSSALLTLAVMAALPQTPKKPPPLIEQRIWNLFLNIERERHKQEQSYTQFRSGEINMLGLARTGFLQTLKGHRPFDTRKYFAEGLILQIRNLGMACPKLFAVWEGCRGQRSFLASILVFQGHCVDRLKACVAACSTLLGWTSVLPSGGKIVGIRAARTFR